MAGVTGNYGLYDMNLWQMLHNLWLICHEFMANDTEFMVNVSNKLGLMCYQQACPTQFIIYSL